MLVKSVWTIVKATVNEFIADPVLRLSAATAYYAAFSIGPLLVLVAGLATFVFGEEQVRQEVGRQLQSFVGPKAAQMVQSMMAAQMKGGSTMAVVVGAAALIFGATAVFIQLQDSLNTIWGVQAKPGHSLWLFVRDRLLSLAMVLGIGFLLLVSMALSTFVNAFTHFVGQAISLPDWIVPLLNALVSFVVIVLLFAFIFKVLPDVQLEWRDVWGGALVSGALFSGGKYLLGLYLSHEIQVSAYGAGSAFIVILLYVYYASVILYLGAEFTQVYARHRAGPAPPSKYAVRANRRKHEPLPKTAPAAGMRAAVVEETVESKSPRQSQKRRRPLWRRLLRDVSLAIPLLGVLLIAARLALPYVVRSYVNRTLEHVEDFNGRVGGIRIDLYRGAYTIENLKLVKTNAAVKEPFLLIPEMDLSIAWKDLFHGALVGEVVVEHPRVNFENGPAPEEKQTGLHKNWKQTLEKLFPFTINRFEVNDATIRFTDPHREPPVDISIVNLNAVATNLTNVEQKQGALPAGLVARGTTTGQGELSLELHMNPLAEAPTFKLLASVTNLNLTALNDFMRSYGNFDVENGTFTVFLDVAAAHEQYQGFVKPFFFDLKIFSWHEAERQNILHDFWEAIVAGISHILRNQPYDQLATTIPISGTLEGGSNVDIWATVGGVLRNAFVRALLPTVKRPAVPLPGDQSASSQ